MRDATAIALNGVIGAGIFALPAQLSTGVGAFSPWIFVISGLLMVPIAYSMSRVVHLRPITGGPVAYANEAFGPVFGFAVGWLALLGSAAALAANTNALIVYFGSLNPVFDHGILRIALILAIWGIFTGVNVIGVREGVGTLAILTLLKLIPLLLLIGTGIWATRGLTQAFQGSGPMTGTLAPTGTLALYAFIGFEQALVPAGETRNANQSIPRAILLSIACSTILYAVIQMICVLHLPTLSNSNAPLADLAFRFYGAWGARLIVLAAAVSIAGNLLSGAVTHPRYAFTMARNGHLPLTLSQVHERFRTPWAAILFSGALISSLAASGTFVILAKMAVLAKFLVYAISIASLGRWAGRRALLGVPLLALGLCTVVISQAQSIAWITLTGALCMGFVIYCFPSILKRLELLK